ncbi:hypothetical protein OIY81_494 [Cryptosporidium canis]|uniref:Uncharacterized protein n=1 Tax=Cryptosporidium canis TaxID=195482 RepID=A0ABQ8P9G8_9CRYT|nr:hypothetical protein OJ252_1828 [Cryptosporidium canis]KAJ1614440.1 hypothetical protein OIY81_494 [Cryptosporidium canis]
MSKFDGQHRVDYLGLCLLSDFSFRISHFINGKFCIAIRSYKFSTDCPTSIKLRFSSYIDKIASSAIYKVDSTLKRLKWMAEYTIFLKKEYGGRLLIIFLVRSADINFNIEIILSELKFLIEALYASNITGEGDHCDTRLYENKFCESSYFVNITEFIFSEPKLIKKHAGVLIEKINNKKVDFLCLLADRIRASLNDSLRNILSNLEDLKILEVKSAVLKSNSHILFRDATREGSNMINSILASAVIIAVVLFLLK